MTRDEAFANITRLTAGGGVGLSPADWDVLELSYRTVDMEPPSRPPARIQPTLSTPLGDYPNASVVKRQYSLD